MLARAAVPSWRDARHVQIAALLAFLALEVFWLDFGASPAQAAASILSTVLVQALLCRLFGARFEWRSALITGCSLALLLRTHEPALWIAAGALAMGSKFGIRARGKHLFNPACFAIVALLATASDHVWVSPGLWGSHLWLAFLMAGFGALVLARAARLDIGLAFLGFYAAHLLGRALWLGDPLAIPLHQMQSGGLVLFTFFMITDPRSTPDRRAGRILFAALVAALAYQLQFHWQVREGLYWALFAVSLLTPLIDRGLPAPRFTWSQPRPKEA